MAYKGAESDPYVYPGTDVLRNLADLRDEEALRNFETEVSVFRHARLLADPISGNFDLVHLKAIHRYLFQDVYVWAGELRTVDIAKGTSRFGSHQFIEGYARRVFARLAHDRAQWIQAGTSVDFPEKLAEYLGEINAMHPFREGNGRAQRAFISQLAVEHGFRIGWERIGQEQMIQASIASIMGDDRLLGVLLRANLIPAAALNKSRSL